MTIPPWWWRPTVELLALYLPVLAVACGLCLLVDLVVDRIRWRRGPWLYRQAGVLCRADRKSIEELKRAGWRVSSKRSPWGSVWMKRLNETPSPRPATGPDPGQYPGTGEGAF